MSEYPENYNYKKLPNAAYCAGLLLFREAEMLWIDYTKLSMSQHQFSVDHAHTLKGIPSVRDVAGIAVKLDDYIFVMDGHHRAYAAYLRGDKRVLLHLVDLNKYFSEKCQRHKNKTKIGLDDLKAADLEEAGLL